MLASAKTRGIEMIVPGKRKRNYTHVSTIGPGDELVRLKRTKHSHWVETREELPKEMMLRRIVFTSAEDGRSMVVYTTLLDSGITAQDIVTKYFTRWHIELSIREIKTLMDIDVIRSKSLDMAEKELLSALIAYNLVRALINQSVAQTGFSPSASLLRLLFKGDPDLRIDKLGRRYDHWSPGRLGYTHKNAGNATNPKAPDQ